MEIIEKLDKVADLQARLDLTKIEFDEKRAEILSAVKDQLDVIDGQCAYISDGITEEIQTLTDEIKAEIIKSGKTVKGARLQAVYTKGRISWDTKALEGYAVAYPEILPFRKEGEPSVSIRAIK